MLIDNSMLTEFTKLELSGVEWRVLWKIILMSSDGTEFNIRTIEKDINVCYNSVIRAIRTLIERNIISKSQVSSGCFLNENHSLWVLKEDRVDDTRPAPLNSDGFKKLLFIYPRKTRIKETFDEWIRLNPSKELTERILSRVQAFKESEAWKKDSGKWIPSILTFVKNRRWEDEVSMERDWRDV